MNTAYPFMEHQTLGFEIGIEVNVRQATNIDLRQNSFDKVLLLLFLVKRISK